MREFLRWVISLTFISTIYCVVMRLVFHLGYPYDWPFFMPQVRFSDFTIFREKFALFHTAAFFTTGFPINYPAAMTVIYEMSFRFAGPYALDVFLIAAVLGFVIPAVLFGRALEKRGLSVPAATAFVGIVLVSSWPALAILDRANVEVFVWMALAFGTWAYAREKEWTAAAMFGFAAALKLFPFVFLALFLTRKKFPKLVFGGLVFGAVTLLSLAILGPTIPIAYHGLALGMASFKANYMAKYLPNEGGLDHSILAFCKAILATVLRHHSDRASRAALKVYLPLTAAGGLLLYFLRIRKLPWRNQLLALTIVSIYFTPFSGDGTLLHLYYSFALCSFLAIDAWKRQIEIPGLRIIFLCFAWLFSIESFFIFAGHRFEGQGKCIALGILLVCALKYRLGPPTAFEEEPAFPDASRVETAIMLPE